MITFKYVQIFAKMLTALWFKCRNFIRQKGKSGIMREHHMQSGLSVQDIQAAGPGAYKKLVWTFNMLTILANYSI